MTIQEGKRIYLEVDVFGKPAPQVEWQLKGVPIKSGDMHGVTLKSDTPTRHSLIVAKAIRSKDDGQYKAIARNDAGEACSSCVVSILGGSEDVVIERPVPVVLSAKQDRAALSEVAPVSASSVQSKCVNQQGSSVVESSTTTTTIITETEEHMYQSRVTQVISPVPMPPEDLAALTVRKPTATSCLISQDPSLLPGPEPEILVAPGGSISWSKPKNQVLEKVKKLEEETSEAALTEPPVGGVRIIPIIKWETLSPTPTSTKHVQFDASGEIARVQPIQLPVVAPRALIPYLVEPHDTSRDTTTFASSESYNIENTMVHKEEHQQEHRQSRDTKYIRPSKFVPEKMRESDHDSEIEATVIPSKWVPPAVRVATPVATTGITSAFVTNTASTSTCSTSTLTSSASRSPVIPQSAPTGTATRGPEPVGVKSIAKQWPPNYSHAVEISHQSISSIETRRLDTTNQGSLGRLSPIPHAENAVALSPTPNKEALEMDKMWARPIRFASPVTVAPVQSSIRTAPPVTPTLASVAGIGTHSPTSTSARSSKPEVPPKPASCSWIKRTTPTPYSPITSPLPTASSSLGIKPEVPPKPAHLRSPISPQPPSRPMSSSAGEHLYYVSTVSTPRTTPIPPQLGWISPVATTPVPAEMGSSYHTAFQEKREFFESTMTASSYSALEETGSHQQRPCSSLAGEVHPSGISLLDQSLLPPPGEPPVFMFQPPPTPTTPTYSTVASTKSTVVQVAPNGKTSTTTMSSSKQVSSPQSGRAHFHQK